MTMPNIDPDLQKQAVKEALQEWLDKKFDQIDLEFGRWTRKWLFRAAIAGILGGSAYLYLISQGWHK